MIFHSSSSNAFSWRGSSPLLSLGPTENSCAATALGVLLAFVLSALTRTTKSASELEGYSGRDRHYCPSV